MPAVTLDNVLGKRLDALFQKRPEPDLNIMPEKKFGSRSRTMSNQIFSAANAWRESQLEEYRRTSNEMPQIDEILADPKIRAAFQPKSSGYDIVEQIGIDANLFSKMPTDFQRELIDFGVQLLGRKIFGLEWKVNQIEIRRKLGWDDETHGIAGVMTGRKEGKSTGLSMLDVLAMFNLPGIKVAVFSKTKSQACIILNMAKILIASHPRRSEFKIEAHAESITLTNLNDESDKRTCTAYAGNADVSEMFLFVFFI